MPLSLQSRRVGDVTIVKCVGRIVEGAESAALTRHLDGLLPHHPHVVLDVGEVDFLDSSGVGLLVRYLTRTRAASGDIVLCAVPPKIEEVLRVTRLRTLFKSHASETEAVSAFYQGATSSSAAMDFKSEILCVDRSVDVLAYVRELLGQAGYSVASAGNLPDALTLLIATRPTVIVIGADLRAATGTQTAATFNRLADAVAVVELPADFSRSEAGEAGQQILDQVRAAKSKVR